MPLADVSNTEWRTPGAEVKHKEAAAECHLLMLVTPNGGPYQAACVRAQNMPLADVSNTEWRQNILLGFRAASHATC